MGVLVETDRELECDLHLTFTLSLWAPARGPSSKGPQIYLSSYINLQVSHCPQGKKGTRVKS